MQSLILNDSIRTLNIKTTLINLKFVFFKVSYVVYFNVFVRQGKTEARGFEEDKRRPDLAI